MGTTPKRVIVIGSGVESLVAACFLARAGCETTVVERRADPGGTRAPWPEAGAFTVPLVLDDSPHVHPMVARRLPLARHGAKFSTGPMTTAVSREGGMLTLPAEGEIARTAAAACSDGDAATYDRFTVLLARLSQAITPGLHRALPAGSRAQDLWTAVLTGRRVLGLSREEAFAFLRWPPMAVADLVDEWFESEPLRALVATRGLFGVFAGPRSAGTSAVLLLRAAADGGLVPSGATIDGGGAALVQALVGCAREAGVALRVRSDVTRILVERERVSGVLLQDGSRLEADAVVSGIGPRRTLLDLLEPMTIGPDLARRAAHVRARGTIARALVLIDDAGPLFSRATTPPAGPSTIHLVPDVDGLERGFDAMKYGGWAEDPWLDVRVHAGPADTARPAGRHALSVTVHQVPCVLREGTWPAARDRLLATAIDTLGRHVPGIAERITAAHLLTPDDLEHDLGLAGGHPLHAELSLDQLWMARPALGLGGYRAPVTGLYLCGPGTHPGVGPAGTSGLYASRAVMRDGQGP